MYYNNLCCKRARLFIVFVNLGTHTVYSSPCIFLFINGYFVCSVINIDVIDPTIGNTEVAVDVQTFDRFSTSPIYNILLKLCKVST